MPDEKTKKPTDMLKPLRDKAIAKAMPDEVPEYRLGESVDPAFAEREARKAARPDVQMERYKKNVENPPLWKRALGSISHIPSTYYGAHRGSPGRHAADPDGRRNDAEDYAVRAFGDRIKAGLEKKKAPLEEDDLTLNDWEFLKKYPEAGANLYRSGILGGSLYDFLKSTEDPNNPLDFFETSDTKQEVSDLKRRKLELHQRDWKERHGE